MTPRHVVWRTIRHYRGSSLAVIAGLAVATAVITGSLIIGSSLRGSLLDLSLARLGGVNHAAVLPRAVSDQIAAGTDALALLTTTGTATPVQGEPNPVGVTVWGVEAGFITLQSLPALPADGLLINAALARDLHVKAGDEVALSVNRPRSIGLDSLFARRKLAEVMATLTLPVAAVLPDNGPGDFRLDGQSGRPRNAFLPREALQRALTMAGKANVLVAPVQQGDSSDLTAALTPRLSLEDYGLHLRVKPHSLSLTSDAFTLTEAQRSAVARAKSELGARVLLTSTYLATAIRAPNGREIAYAIVTGVSDGRAVGLGREVDERTEAWIALGPWAAQDLQARPGDQLTLEYLATSPDGTFPRKSLQARFVGVVPMQGLGADPHLMPDYEGLTDAVTLGEWKPPFPIDMSRITPRDEAYWDKYKTVPKAFVEYFVTDTMWGGKDSLTSIEITPPQGQSPAAFAPRLAQQLLTELQTGQPVIAFTNTAERALQSSAGSTDFSQLFLALSMFIIAAGAGLAAMLVSLGVERRARQIGLLLAIGLTPRRVRRLLLGEGLILNLGGVILGLPVGVLYAAGLLEAMGAFWRAALGDAPALWLHVAPTDLLYAALGGLLVGVVTILLALRSLGRLEPMHLWQGGPGLSPASRRLAARLVALVVMLAAATGLLVWPQANDAAPKAIAFFGAGLLLLVAGLVALHLALTWPRRHGVLQSLRGLAWRNAGQNPRRSLLVCGLIAAATFVIITTAASTRDFGRADTFDRAGPAGGFNLMATSQVPLPYDPATPEGRRNLGFAAADEALLARCTVVSLLASPGDDLSCANAAKANAPQMLGYGQRFFADGRFAGVLVEDDINYEATPGIVAKTDSGTLEWRLYKHDGDLWETQDAFGRPMTLQLFAGFSRSIFAGLLVVSEADLKHLYPEATAPSFFLIETPREDEQAVVAALRRTLGDLGLQVRPTRETLAEYAAGENVYISMFIALGALGLLLGTVGLSVVTARNIIERRAELALLTATGFSRQRLVSLLLLEHGGLLVTGLLLGAVAALIAMVPQLASPESSVNWAGLVLALLAVLAVGLGANVVAIRRHLDEDLVGALRHE
ncbi:ABC transporter permease [bacterium]|nr:ABC transporter permease [bacterium]